MLTDERVQKLTDYLSSDPERMEKLFETDVETAQKKINADGYDFTVEELKEFAEAVVTVNEKTKNEQNGELDAEALDDVSGGVLTVGTVSCVCALVKLGAPYAWKAGTWLGQKIVGR